MEIDPFAMLEVTLQEEVEDDECILVRDDEEEAMGSEQEQGEGAAEGNQPPLEEIDPLSCLQTPSFDTLQNMPHVWVHNNISNLATTTKPEDTYRNATFANVDCVVRKRVHCTVCQHHVGCSVRTHPSSIEHPVLKVLLCQKCSLMYKSVPFLLGPSGKESTCRWCGGLREGASHFKLWTCLNCPFSFCEICVFQNLPVYKRYKKRDDWTCFVCNLRELWPARALLWAVQRYILYLLQNPSNEVIQEGDLSQCCKRKRPYQPYTPASPPERNLSALLQQKKKKTEITPIYVKMPTGVMKVVNCAGMTLNGTMRGGGRSLPKNTAFQQQALPQQPLTVRVDWLKSRLKNFTNNIETFAIKLQEMEKGLPVTENLHKVKTTLDTLTSLLELSSNQCRDFKTDLLKEWKAKTDKFLFDRGSASSTSNQSHLKSALAINSNQPSPARSLISLGQSGKKEAKSGKKDKKSGKKDKKKGLRRAITRRTRRPMTESEESNNSSGGSGTAEAVEEEEQSEGKKEQEVDDDGGVKPSKPEDANKTTTLGGIEEISVKMEQQEEVQKSEPNSDSLDQSESTDDRNGGESTDVSPSSANNENVFTGDDVIDESKEHLKDVVVKLEREDQSESQ